MKKALLLGKPLCYILVTTKSSPLSRDRIIIVQDKHVLVFFDATNVKQKLIGNHIFYINLRF
jgi:hypothetical protein